MFTAIQFRASLTELGISQTEAAQLLSVTPRTVRRWVDETDALAIPGPAEQALRAWLELHRLGLPWHPASDDVQQIERHLKHATELCELLHRVEARGGPAAPWVVDLDRSRATLGPMEVSFYHLQNGGFSPQSYSRTDEHPDQKRDWPLIEDAFACIAKAIAGTDQTKFVFTVTLHNETVLMWDIQRVPTVVAKIPCTIIRDALDQALNQHITDEQCRVLMDSNKEIITEVAEAMYADKRYVIRNDGIGVVEIGVPELQAVANRMSLEVLKIAPYWE